MLVQEEFVTKLSGYLSSGSLIYLSSDSNRVILWMIHKFLHNNFFKLIKSQDIKDLSGNAFFPPHSPSSCPSATSAPCPDGALAETGKDGDEECDGEDMEEEETEIENNEIEKLSEYWIDYNPLGELSERELICEVDWRRVKRCILIKV